MPTMQANGLGVAYEVAGQGPPLVLLHGAGSSGAHDFAKLGPVLARSFTTFAPDARGHATTTSQADSREVSADLLADDLAAFLEGLGLERVHLLGFSMGAMTALRFAVREPARLDSLVVIGISTEREPRATIARRLLDPERIAAHDPAWAAALAARHDPGQGRDAWRRLLPAIARDVESQSLIGPGELRAVGAPALVACGDRDPFIPVDQAWNLARQLRDGRLLVVPDCGHDVPSQRPGLLETALEDFYRSAVGHRTRTLDSRTSTPQ